MIPTSIPADTSPEAVRVQREVYQRMSPNKRLELALGMSRALRNIVAAGVRQRHPEFSEEQVKLAVIRSSLGDELFGKAYPGVQLPR